MRSSTYLLIAAVAITTQALDQRQGDLSLEDVSDYAASVCLPSLNETEIDLDAPCNGYRYTFEACLYGSNVAADTYLSGEYGFLLPSGNTLREQQICFCQSQAFDLYNGCGDCHRAHGLASIWDGWDWPSRKAVSSFSASFCQATNTASMSFEAALESAFPLTGSITQEVPDVTSSGMRIASSYSISDPLGNKTAASLYFTPAVTGSAQYTFFEASPITSVLTHGIYRSDQQQGWTTETLSAISSASSRTNFGTDSAGDITPTAIGASTVSADLNTASNSVSSSTKSGAAVATLAADRIAVAGVMGLAAIVVYL